jgi:hypothetical protein
MQDRILIGGVPTGRFGPGKATGDGMTKTSDILDLVLSSKSG